MAIGVSILFFNQSNENEQQTFESGREFMGFSVDTPEGWMIDDEVVSEYENSDILFRIRFSFISPEGKPPEWIFLGCSGCICLPLSF